MASDSMQTVRTLVRAREFFGIGPFVQNVKNFTFMPRTK